MLPTPEQLPKVRMRAPPDWCSAVYGTNGKQCYLVAVRNWTCSKATCSPSTVWALWKQPSTKEKQCHDH